jgi:hypothetical protein
MAKYDIPKLLISILESKVKDVIGEDAIAVLRAPVTEAELQVQLNAAAQRAEARWLAKYSDHDARDAVQGMRLADLPAIRSAIRKMYDAPTTSVVAQTLHEQLTNVLPKGFEAARIENALADYLEKLRQELVMVDGLREKLTALAELETARGVAQTAKNTGQTNIELRRLNEQVTQLIEYFYGQSRPGTAQTDTFALRNLTNWKPTTGVG